MWIECGVAALVAAVVTRIQTVYGMKADRWKEGRIEVKEGVPRPIPSGGVIRYPGRYLLIRDMVSDRPVGVKIEADHVTLDLNGYAIRSSEEPTEGTMGVFIEDVADVRIVNGKIDGWWYGVHALRGGDLTLEWLQFDPIAYVGVSVSEGKRLLVRECRFGRMRRELPKPKADYYCIGINARAVSMRVFDSVFEDRFGDWSEREREVESVMILLPPRGCDDALIAGNRFSYDRLSKRSYGLWAGKENRLALYGNEINNARYAVVTEEGTRLYAAGNTLLVDTDDQDEEALAVADKNTHGFFLRGTAGVVVDNRIAGCAYPVQNHHGTALVERNDIVEGRTSGDGADDAL